MKGLEGEVRESTLERHKKRQDTEQCLVSDPRKNKGELAVLATALCQRASLTVMLNIAGEEGGTDEVKQKE